MDMWGRWTTCQWLLWTVQVVVLVCGKVGEETEPNGHCDQKEGLCMPTDGPHLNAVPPIKVGHVDELHLDPGRTLYRKTLSIKPALFEIADFLTPAECKHMKKVAMSAGLQPSETYNSGLAGPVKVMDVDGDKRLDVSEMRLTLENSYDIYFNDADVHKMYEELKLDQNNDGLLTPAELGRVEPGVVQGWLREYIAIHPSTKSRVSRQVWLYVDRVSDPTVHAIQNRVAALTGLPPTMVAHSDVQVVNYALGGHYHAHWDSSHHRPDQQCCSPTLKKRCRICRFMTVMLYLNDVEEGGGTAFPVADNTTLDIHKLRREHLINLREHCRDANLVVAPSRGKAVMWYNHDVNPVTGWMGDMDEFSWHGGCPVMCGEKWIANFWVKTTEDRDADIRRMDL